MVDRALNILLVEDDEVDVMNVHRAFERNHMTSALFVAGNGIEALSMLRSNLIPKERRLILLDLNMPKMNGIEFLQALRADPELAATPVVVLTTSNDDQDKIDAYNLNVAGYLLKPVTFSNSVVPLFVFRSLWQSTHAWLLTSMSRARLRCSWWQEPQVGVNSTLLG